LYFSFAELCLDYVLTKYLFPYCFRINIEEVFSFQSTQAVLINHSNNTFDAPVHSISAMSLCSICCGNSQLLRSSIGNTCSFRSLKHHSTLIYESLFPSRRHQIRPISIMVLGRTTRRGSKQRFSNSRHLHDESVESPIEEFKLSELEHLKSLQCYNVDEKLSGAKTEWPATILVFDIETSGFSRRNDRIIEFAVRDLIGGKNSTFQSLINPEKDVRNTHVHGISNRMLNRPEVPRYLYILCYSIYSLLLFYVLTVAVEIAFYIETKDHFLLTPYSLSVYVSLQPCSAVITCLDVV
jgi:hypothetical protein